MEHAVSRFGLDPGKCMVVPFGIDRERPANLKERMAGRVFLEEKFGIGGHEKIIYFNGTLDYEPNARALQYIVKELIPVLEEKMEVPFRVLVTGRIVFPEFEHLKSLRHSRYWYAGQAQTVEPFFMGADMFINPVQSGGGIKVKLMEALSYGLPVVSFRAAAEGVDTALAGKGLFLVDDGNTPGFAEAMVKALQAGQQTPDAFYKQYHWSHIAEKVRDRLLELEQAPA
jgi:glycosyltransferase involved in cell wall biosynthesis